MLRTRNKYCSNCLATERFLVLRDCLVCERCSKRLELGTAGRRRDGAADATADGAAAQRADNTDAAWAERPAA